MRADSSIYRSERVAESYSRFRPPIHRAIVDRMMSRVFLDTRLRILLDAGCGAGASTVPLLSHAEHVVGVDPYAAMLRHAPAVAPGALFVQGRLEALPFASGSVDLVATAGAINYSDVAQALCEASRVLTIGGWLAAYDFSAGRRLSVESDLPARYAAFEEALPPGPGYALDLRSLPAADAGLRPLTYEPFVVLAEMTAEAYVQYALSESGVERALARGVEASQARALCEQLFGPIFNGHARTIEFDAVFVLWRKER